MLLGAGNIITTKAEILRLSQPDVTFGVFIPSLDRDIPEKEVTKEEEDVKRAGEIKAAVVQDITGVFSRLETDGDIDFDVAENAVGMLLDEMQHNLYAISSMAMLKDADAYTFTHSVNVSILSMYLVLRTEYAGTVNDIGIGAMLHDIGKVEVPINILHKDGPLDDPEMNTMKRHPLRGAQILHGLGYRNSIAMACVLEHHEKLTGRGYPLRKSGDALSPYGRIVAIADVYDALTTDRPYRKAMKSRDAISIMTQNMSRDLDLNMLREFLIAIGQLEQFCSAADGESGVCEANGGEHRLHIYRNQRYLSKPI